MRFAPYYYFLTVENGIIPQISLFVNMQRRIFFSRRQIFFQDGADEENDLQSSSIAAYNSNICCYLRRSGKITAQ